MERDRRIVTVPNLISVLRLLCAPLFVWLLVDDQGRRGRRRCSAVLGATDWVDGWIARRFDQGSELGKVLDPVADRVLLLVAAVALLVDGSVPIIVGVLVLVREAVVSIAVLVLGDGRRAPHRRAVGGQSGHAVGDVRVPAVPAGRQHRQRPRRRARGSPGSSPSSASCSATTPPITYVPMARAGAARGPLARRALPRAWSREGRDPGRR